MTVSTISVRNKLEEESTFERDILKNRYTTWPHGYGPLKSLKTANVRPLFYQQILAIIRLMPGIACDIPSLYLTRLALASVSVEYTQLHRRTAQYSIQCLGRTTVFPLHQCSVQWQIWHSRVCCCQCESLLYVENVYDLETAVCVGLDKKYLACERHKQWLSGWRT